MKSILKAGLAAATLALGMTSATWAEGWKPEGPIKMIIAFAAGGGADTHSRLVADELSAATGWEIIPEQVTGKGGVNALVALKDMPADGTAIAMVVTESIGYNAAAAKGLLLEASPEATDWLSNGRNSDTKRREEETVKIALDACLLFGVRR